MATFSISSPQTISQQEYKRRIRRGRYMIGLIPLSSRPSGRLCFQSITAKRLEQHYPAQATATAYWSAGLSISLFIVAILSPILGTVSRYYAGKETLFGDLFGVGVFATGLLVLVDTGDWLLASLLFIFARIGWTAANVFYDALLLM